MAKLLCYKAVEGVFTALETTAGWKTLLQLLAPTDQRINVNSYGLYPKGTVNSDPAIKLRLVKQSDAGVGGTVVTAQKRPPGAAETPRTTILRGPFTTDPTISGDSLDLKNVHPQQGFEEPELVPGQWIIAGGERVALQYMNDAGGAAIPADPDIAWEE